MNRLSRPQKRNEPNEREKIKHMKDFMLKPVFVELSWWGVVIRPNIWAGFCFFAIALFCSPAGTAADSASRSATPHKTTSHAAVSGAAYAVEEIPVPRGIAPEIGGLGFTPSGKLVVVTRRSCTDGNDRRVEEFKRLANEWFVAQRRVTRVGGLRRDGGVRLGQEPG